MSVRQPVRRADDRRPARGARLDEAATIVLMALLGLAAALTFVGGELVAAQADSCGTPGFRCDAGVIEAAGVVASYLPASVLQIVLHVLQRDRLLNAAGFGLSMLVTAAIVVGFNWLVGPAGIAIGSVLSILIGNPISGAAVPYQFIAAPWGDVGQLFVAGAASNLVRSLSCFPDVDTEKQWLVLAAWTVGGLLLTVVGHFRDAAPVRLPEIELERAAA